MCTVSSVFPYHGNENGRATSTHPSSAFCVQLSISVPVAEMSHEYVGTEKPEPAGLGHSLRAAGATGYARVGKEIVTSVGAMMDPTTSSAVLSTVVAKPAAAPIAFTASMRF
jgi:hypothetical protein